MGMIDKAIKAVFGEADDTPEKKLESENRARATRAFGEKARQAAAKAASDYREDMAQRKADIAAGRKPSLPRGMRDDSPATAYEE